MSYYRNFIIETYENAGEPSKNKIRARPLMGQGVSENLNVACSVAMREAYPAGTLFKVECKVTDREGSPFLYRHYSWAYELINTAQAKQHIEDNFKNQSDKA